MDVTQSGTNILTRWYSGNSYVKETASGVTKEYTYLGGDAYSAPVAAITQSGTTTYYYLMRDYLGNITHVVNSVTTNFTEYSYDVWGRRRNPTDWSYTLTGQPSLFADRGFTSHEFLSWFNLYNMNGRMYDPLVGRFLSADNYVQDPSNTQCYNRYSYGLNNPLKYSDPSGMLLVPNDPAINAYFWGIQAAEFNNVMEGGGVSYFSKPGVGRNGTGLNGTYYDWYSGVYRSTDKGNPEIGWNQEVNNLISKYCSGSISGSFAGEFAIKYASGIDVYTYNISGKTYGVLSEGDPELFLIVGTGYFVGNPTAGYIPDICWNNFGSVDFGNYKISSKELIKRLNDFAVQTGYDVMVLGGDRSIKRNKLVGGSTNSRHLHGDAADIIVNGTPNRTVAIQAHESGIFKTTIYYPLYNLPGALPPHVHVDLNSRHDNVLMIYKIEDGSNTYLPWHP